VNAHGNLLLVCKNLKKKYKISKKDKKQDKKPKIVKIKIKYDFVYLEIR
jgi:hypothetical protein